MYSKNPIYLQALKVNRKSCLHHRRFPIAPSPENSWPEAAVDRGQCSTFDEPEHFVNEDPIHCEFFSISKRILQSILWGIHCYYSSE